MEQEPLIYRGELTAMLFAIADINENIGVIRGFFEEEDGGGQEPPEDGA